MKKIKEMSVIRARVFGNVSEFMYLYKLIGGTKSREYIEKHLNDIDNLGVAIDIVTNNSSNRNEIDSMHNDNNVERILKNTLIYNEDEIAVVDNLYNNTRFEEILNLEQCNELIRNIDRF